MAEHHAPIEKAGNETIEDADLKQNAIIAVDEERNLSVWQTIGANPKVVFWCAFFAFSAIGWYASRSSHSSIRD